MTPTLTILTPHGVPPAAEVEPPELEGEDSRPLATAAHPDHARRYWACATGPDGWPQTTPAWGLWLDGRVVFATDTESVTAEDSREFPVSVVQLEDPDRPSVVDGVAERLDDSTTLARFVAACRDKYGFELDAEDPDTPVYVVRAHGDLGSEADDLAETMAAAR